MNFAMFVRTLTGGSQATVERAVEVEPLLGPAGRAVAWGMRVTINVFSSAGLWKLFVVPRDTLASERRSDFALRFTPDLISFAKTF